MQPYNPPEAGQQQSAVPQPLHDLRGWKLATNFEHGMRYHDLPRGTQYWKPVEKLGEGTCGEVWKERCLSGTASSSSVFRAVKHIPKRNGSFAQASRREIKALTTFSDDSVVEYQQHFVQIHGWFEDETHWYIAMEFVEYGNLQQHIDRGCIPEPEAASITAQIARALLYMHTTKLVHRDLKPLNILVSHPGPTWHVKVGDFGITRNLSDTVAGTHQIGTFGYMAPEIWDTSQHYTSAIDVWALGAITFCMLTRSPPFPNPMTLPNYSQDPTLFPTLKLRSYTQPCRGFIAGAMAAVPQERMTITEALTHYWLSRNMNLSQRPRKAKSSASLSPSSSLGSLHLNDWSSAEESDGDISFPELSEPPASVLSYGTKPKPARTREARKDMDSISSRQHAQSPASVVSYNRDSKPAAMLSRQVREQSETLNVDPRPTMGRSPSRQVRKITPEPESTEPTARFKYEPSQPVSQARQVLEPMEPSRETSPDYEHLVSTPQRTIEVYNRNNVSQIPTPPVTEQAGNPQHTPVPLFTELLREIEAPVKEAKMDGEAVLASQVNEERDARVGPVEREREARRPLTKLRRIFAFSSESTG